MLFIKRIPEQVHPGLKSALEKLGVRKFNPFQKGELEIYNVSNLRLNKIQFLLEANGISYTCDKKEILSEKIKLVVEKMLCEGQLPVQNVSIHISNALGNNYTYLSHIFSIYNNITIEQYIIRCRIAKAKRMIRETAASMGIIAGILHYSSIAHFSTQFKKITGITPSAYRNRFLLEVQKA